MRVQRIRTVLSNKKLIFAGVPVLLFLLLLFILWLCYPTTSPFRALAYYWEAFNHPHAKMQKEVVGFLPYWRLTDAHYTHFPLMSNIIYFSLTTDGDGNFVKVVGNQTEPGWYDWNTQLVKDFIAHTQITGNAFTLAVSLQRNKSIENLLNNKNAQENFIKNIAQQISSRHLDGINLDIEYIGDPKDALRNKMTTFLQAYHEALKKQFPSLRLSIDFLPTGGRDKGLFDFAKIAPFFDRFIIMSYDYYSSGSQTAGPIAPMQGFKQNKYFFDIVTTYADYEKMLPKQKLIMGVPYYGWDWPVANGQVAPATTLAQNDTNGYPAVLSYGRMRQDADLQPNQCFWDSTAASPWCWYKDSSGIDHQVWFENARSIQTKFAFASSQKFAGIAVWTLGFDKQYEDLWHLIQSFFTR